MFKITTARPPPALPRSCPPGWPLEHVPWGVTWESVMGFSHSRPMSTQRLLGGVSKLPRAWHSRMELGTFPSPPVPVLFQGLPAQRVVPESNLACLPPSAHPHPLSISESWLLHTACPASLPPLHPNHTWSRPPSLTCTAQQPPD